MSRAGLQICFPCLAVLRSRSVRVGEVRLPGRTAAGSGWGIVIVGHWFLQSARSATGRVGGLSRPIMLASAFAAFLAFPANAVSAQSAAGLSGKVLPVCEIETSAPEVEAPEVAVSDGSGPADAAAQSRPTSLIALCGGTGIYLGDADRYAVASHVASGAMAIEIKRLGRTRVMLLSRDARGRVSAEDISGALAVAAGRLPTGGLRGLATDLAQFGEEGTIGLAAAGGDAAATNGDARAFSLAEHLSLVEQNRSASLMADAGGVE